MDSKTPVIQFMDVAKGYSGEVILQNINETIYKGEFITLIGPSGCGKTTFLKLINALLLPDIGNVTVLNENTLETDVVELRRRIGYVIQNIGLFPHMNVRKNLEYVPSLFKAPTKDCFTASELMDIVSLDKEYLTRMPDELSGGQKQRVGIGRALAAKPDILLMDEPFSAVDEISRKQLQDSIKKIHEELGLTIVFVTHSIEEAFKLGTRVAIFGEEKTIEQFDAPDVIVSKPANDYVRRFISNYCENSIYER